MLVLSAAAMHAASVAGPRDDEVATVKVYRELSGSTTTYTYFVTNHSEFPLVGFAAGYDHYHSHPELSGSDPRAVTSPPQWEGHVVTLEESNQYQVKWDILAQGASIKPRQTLGGFRVVMANDDVLLANGHWTVTVDGPPLHASSRIQLVQGREPARPRAIADHRIMKPPLRVTP